MAIDRSIFTLRIHSSADLNPTPDELRLFLDGAGAQEPRAAPGADLVRYTGLVDGLRAFQERLRSDPASTDVRERMFYGVLGHSQFVHPGLQLAVEQFKFHRHALGALDFAKPEAFIRSARAEIAKLNPKRIDEAAKLLKLQALVMERQRALDLLNRRSDALCAELDNIVRYIRDNLARIARLCEASIVLLVDPRLAQREERLLIDDIKEAIKDQLRDARFRGQVTRQDLDAVKQAVDILAREAAALLRDDVYALSAMYEAAHDHTQRFIRELDGLSPELHDIGDRGRAEIVALSSRVEQVLVALVTSYRFELRTTVAKSETAYEQLLREQRIKLIERLFAALNQERRTRLDRRFGEDRRKFQEPRGGAPERRSGKDRRSGRSRRRPATGG